MDYLLAYSCLLLPLIDEFPLSRNSPISLFELYTVQLLWNLLLGWNPARCKGLEEVPCHDSCPTARCLRGLRCQVAGQRQGCVPQGIKSGQTRKQARQCREKYVAATPKEKKYIYKNFSLCVCILTQWYQWINPSGTSISSGLALWSIRDRYCCRYSRGVAVNRPSGSPAHPLAKGYKFHLPLAESGVGFYVKK